jgi:cytochrome b561
MFRTDAFLTMGCFSSIFWVQMNRQVFNLAETIHQFLAYGLFALAGLHALAARIIILCGAMGFC